MATSRKTSSKAKSPVKTSPTVVASTAVRNSAVPPKTVPAIPAARKVVTHEQIAIRAYEISRSGAGSSEIENWLRAERELRG